MDYSSPVFEVSLVCEMRYCHRRVASGRRQVPHFLSELVPGDDVCRVVFVCHRRISQQLRHRTSRACHDLRPHDGSNFFCRLVLTQQFCIPHVYLEKCISLNFNVRLH